MSIIAVDMTPVLPGGENGGAKIFAIELLRSFHKAATEDHFLLLTASWNHEDLAILDGSNMSRLCVLTGKKPRPKSLTAIYPGLLRSGLGRIGRYIKKSFPRTITPGRLLGSRGVDLLFCPFTAPTYAEPGIPLISVVHDLQHRDCPHFFTSNEIELRDSFMEEVCQRANAIVCVSENSRQAVIKHFRVKPKKTKTIHNCIQSRLSKPSPESLGAQAVDLGIDGRSYMFYPANFWPHKNHRILLTAYGMFLAGNPETKLDLVFTGALDDIQREVENAARKMGLSEKVHFLGFLPQEQLETVWFGCEFLVFPSLYEGFGIPVLEAMSIGKPVLCSNCASLPEVAGDAALYFDPRKPESIVKCIEKIDQDSSLRSKLVNRGFSRASNFRLEAMTNDYLKLFGSLIRNPAPISKGVTGIFEDGWVGEQMLITYGTGPENRILEMDLEAPSWLPSRRVKVKLQNDERTLQRVNLHRGKEVTIQQRLSGEEGFLTLSVNPTFTPSECNMGDDSRILGIRCQGCWILTHVQERKSLLGDGRE